MALLSSVWELVVRMLGLVQMLAGVVLSMMSFSILYQQETRQPMVVPITSAWMRMASLLISLKYLTILTSSAFTT